MTPQNLRTLAQHIDRVADRIATGLEEPLGAQGVADMIVDGMLADLRANIPGAAGEAREQAIAEIDNIGDELTRAFVNLLGRLKVQA